MSVANLPTLKYIEVDSIDITDYVGAFIVTEKFSEYFKTAVITCKKTLSNLITYDDKTIIGKSVIIKRGVSSANEDILFRGYVASAKFEGAKATLSCEDKLSRTKKQIINESFDWNVDPEAGVISELVKTIISENTNLTYSASSIQDSGSFFIREKFICRHRTVWSALQELAYSIDWSIYYNPNDDLVYFEPKGYRSGTTILSTSTNIVKLPKWNIDSSNLFNQITVIGSPQEVIKKAGPYQLDGSQAGWGTLYLTLNDKPIAVKLLCDTDAVPTTEKVLGVEGTSTTYDYSVNKEQYKIDFNTATFAPTDAHYAIVEYTYNLPVNVTRKNQTSIDLYSDGTAKAVTQNREDIKTNEDAASWASKQLAVYSEPFYSTTLQVRGVNDLMIGWNYTIQDNIQGIEEDLMIKTIVYTYPYRYDEIEVSNKEYRELNLATEPSERIRRLEEKQTDDSDKLVIYNDFSRTLNIEKRWSKVWQKGISGTFMIWGHPSSRGLWGTPNTWNTWQSGFILGHPTFGLIGTGILGEAPGTQTYLKKLNPGNNIFKEFVYDTEFYDGVNDSVLSLDLFKTPVSGVVDDLSSEGNDGTFKINASAYYPFNGNANDESVNSNNGVVTGATLTTDHLGNANNAYSFDGTDDKIDCGDITTAENIDNLTISLWVKKGNKSDAQGLVTKGSYYKSTSSWALQYMPSTTRINWSVSDSRYRWVAYELPENVWVNITTVYSNTNSFMKIYINGVEATGGANTGTFITIPNTANSVQIGNNVLNEYFKGDISDVLILPVALTATEVLNLYNVTKEHKLDKPLVTKTDSLGNTITGYELSGTTDTTFNSYIEGDASVFPSGVSGATGASIYIEFLNDHISTMGGNANIFYRLFGNSLYPRMRVTTGNDLEFQYRFDGSTKTLTSNDTILSNVVNKVLITLKSGVQEIYLNNVLIASGVVTGTTIDGGAEKYLIGRDTNLYYSARDTTISKPIIWNRVLTETERTNLFTYGNIQSTGTTWNTTTKTISITAGGNFFTELISLGTTHTFYKVEIGSSTGTFTTQISGDGGTTYQTVTLNTRTAFTTADTNGVILKITATTDAVLSNTYNNDNSYKNPAIKITLED